MPPSVTGVGPIPAMTTDAERECYYRLAKEGADKGTIVELGAWMGASTAYIAAGVRDSGVKSRVQVYDKFQSKPGHARKVKEFYNRKGIENKMPVGPCVFAFQQNLGPLMEYVEAHQCQIEKLKWGGDPISVLITDAPKRIPAISPVLTTFRKALQPGSIMAWQDFCHFPSYEIPACLYRIREHIEFVEAIVPGTTLVFRVKSQWSKEEVSLEALSPSKWTPEEITAAWDYWLNVIDDDKVSLFACGEAMFLCDIGHTDKAVTTLAAVCEAPEVLKKWRYLKDARPDFVTRYAPLFDYLAIQGVLKKEAA